MNKKVDDNVHSLTSDWLIGFYVISTFVGYLMPGSVNTYREI